MAVEDQEKTAFTTLFGCYMYTAMTFGLKNAGATYQRCMTECLKEQIGHNVHVYIDDVVVKSNRTDDSPRNVQYAEEENEHARQNGLDLLDEERDLACSRTAIYQQGLHRYHSRRVRSRSFQEGD